MSANHNGWHSDKEGRRKKEGRKLGGKDGGES